MAQLKTLSKVYLVLILSLLCLLPWLLGILGVDFGHPLAAFDAKDFAAVVNAADSHRLLTYLSGFFIHTLLEWFAFTLGVVILLVGYSHFKVDKNWPNFALCLVLFFSGALDAVHTLTADGLVFNSVEQIDFAPISWAINRLFHAAMILIIVLLIVKNGDSGLVSREKFVEFSVLGMTLAIFLYLLIVHLSAINTLPQTYFPQHVISRPYDLFPFSVYLIGLLYALVRIDRKLPNVFVQTVILSLIPSLMSELHMVYGSENLFDHHFMIAHGLKIIVYLIPLLGLIVCHTQTLRAEFRLNQQLIQLTTDLRMQTIELKSANDELEIFTAAAHHDLQEPVRIVQTYTSKLANNLSGQNGPDYFKDFHFIRLACQQLNQMNSAIVTHIEWSKRALTFAPTELLPWATRAAAQTNENSEKRAAQDVHLFELMVEEKQWPLLWTDAEALYDILLRLFDNAQKFNRGAPRVNISLGAQTDTTVTIKFADNGLPIDPRYFQTIFKRFTRLYSYDDYPGAGMGLAIASHLVTRLNGKIWMESSSEAGNNLHLELPKFTGQRLQSTRPVES